MIYKKLVEFINLVGGNTEIELHVMVVSINQLIEWWKVRKPHL